MVILWNRKGDARFRHGKERMPGRLADKGASFVLWRYEVIVSVCSIEL